MNMKCDHCGCNQFLLDYDAVRKIDSSARVISTNIAEFRSEAVLCAACFQDAVTDTDTGEKVNLSPDLLRKVVQLAESLQPISPFSYEYDPKNWKEAETPKRKKDYEGRHIKLLVDSPNFRYGTKSKPSLLKAGSIVRITARVNHGQAATSSYPSSPSLYTDSKDRVLKVQWHCPTCGISHCEGLPEAWIAEGKLVFVEKKTSEELDEAA